MIDELHALDARVMTMVSDISCERADVVRQLNDAGVSLFGLRLRPLPLVRRAVAGVVMWLSHGGRVVRGWGLCG
jgi:hypothetical protein